MRIRYGLPLTFCFISGGFVALSVGQSQEQTKVVSIESSSAAKAVNRPKDFSKLSPLTRQMALSAQRGADWLCRANQPDGRFVYGYMPALKTVLEGDNYLRQAGATIALARAANFTGNEKYLAVARQAVLTLLLDTAIDPQDPHVRHTTLPSVIVNRVAAAGLLILAISELPAASQDLLDQSDQLCAFVARQQNADGSLNYLDGQGVSKTMSEDEEGINYYPGEAIYGLMRSQQQRPANWKTQAVRKARDYYHSWWQSHKNMAFVPWQIAAYSEGYLLTKDQVFAESVNEMGDWLCGLQYTQLDPNHPLWVGGFMGWLDGKPMLSEPQVSSASYAEGLAAACRVTRQVGDLARYQRHREALERCLQFLTALQYTDANTQHFADWYRPVLLGGFHASHKDGNLRIDYTQHAVCALVNYLSYVAD